MRDLRAFLLISIVGCISSMLLANAGEIKSVPLPPDEGAVVIGAAFSPDSSQLALIRKAISPDKSSQHHILQIMELRSRQELSHVGIFKGDPESPASNTDLVTYSADGQYLLVATKGSDVLLILDASTLREIKRFDLRPEAKSRNSLGKHLYFSGVIDIAAAAKADIFCVLTHDELKGNEVIVGSFLSGRIMNQWSLGRGRAATPLGEIAISVSENGSRIAVSLLPVQNSLPKNFDNIRIYDSGTGRIVKSIQTASFIGKISFISNEALLMSRIDTPGLFSKKVCLEKWLLNTGKLGGLFCDDRRNVNLTHAVSLTANRVVGFASQIHRSIEGQVYAGSGKVDVWDMKSGDMIASSSDMPYLVSYIKVSSNGEWIMANQTLLHISPVP